MLKLSTMAAACKFLVMLLLVLEGVLGGNILIIHPLYAASHEMILRSFGEHMITRGHSGTMLKFQNAKNPQVADSNITVIELKIKTEAADCSNFVTPEGKFDIGLNLAERFWTSSGNLDIVSVDFINLVWCHCDSLFSDKELFQHLQKQHFDAAIVDLHFNLCGVALAKALDLPVASFWMCNFAAGETLYTPMVSMPSIAPGAYSGISPVMGFWERVQNTVYKVAHHLLVGLTGRMSQSIVSKHFPNLKPIWELVHDIDIHLVVPNHLTTSPQSTIPNVFHIGGPHLRDGGAIPEVS